MIEAEIKFKT